MARRLSGCRAQIGSEFLEALRNEATRFVSCHIQALLYFIVKGPGHASLLLPAIGHDRLSRFRT